MENHFSLSDDQFVFRFEDTTLDPAWFTHVGHLRLAYLYIRKYGPTLASKRLCHFINQFDKIHGKGDKFHKTITCASVGVLLHFINKARSNKFTDLLEEFPRLEINFKALLLTHYSAEILQDANSKVHYVMPDKLFYPVFDFN